ncbi:MAG TPA: hypothetical protein VGD69_00715 [Herpetosiphonaceae bacterium]
MTVDASEAARLSEDRKYVWDYFQLHSSQRIASFNFYITLATAILAALGAILQQGANLLGVAAVLGVVLVLFSFVFWKMDQRNTGLIKNAEAALKYFEEQTADSSSPTIPIINLFQRDEHLVHERRSRPSIFFWRNHFSYTDCFNLVFFTFGLLGALGAVLAIARLF